MSHFNLMDQPNHRHPICPNLSNTLLFIQTQKYIRLGSLASIDYNFRQKTDDLLDSQLSLQHKMQNVGTQTLFSNNTIKKRKKTGCTCKKTKCLKMYCECFSSGKMCTPECACCGCQNDHDHVQAISLAQEAAKIKSQSASKQNHSKGCNCKKSQCQKKYCECFNAGLSCNSDCKCQDCANGECDDHNKIKLKNPMEQIQESSELYSLK